MDNTYTLEPCQPCPPIFVATRSYTALCQGGRVGESVTITRQARSHFSEAHAGQLAMALAKCEAEAEIQCYFQASASLYTACSAIDPALLVTETAQSKVSPEDAYNLALAAAQQAAANLCEFGFPTEHLPIMSMGGIPLFAMGGQQLTTTA